MLIDASAIVAVLNLEAKANEIKSVIDLHRKNGGKIFMIATSFYEATTGLCKARTGKLRFSSKELAAARDAVETFVTTLNIEPLVITSDVGNQAVEAVMRFGKIVSHPAELNFGDCIVYGAAKHNSLPLLFIGNDFARTDLKSVLASPET